MESVFATVPGTSPAEPQVPCSCGSVESSIESAIHQAETCAASAWNRGKDCIRDYPLESVSFAAATGYFWTRLPVGGLFAIAGRVVAALAPPALAVMGACA